VDDGTELAHFLGDCCIMTPPGDATALAQAILTLKDAPYSEAQERERLNRARLLSKETVIVDFLHAMNFRTSDSPSTSVLQPI
jgi:hypothetical protein